MTSIATRYATRAATAAGCLAAVSTCCKAADFDAVSLTGVSIHAVASSGDRASSSPPGASGSLAVHAARASRDSARPGLLPATVELSRSRWSSDGARLVTANAAGSAMANGAANSAVSVDNVSYRKGYGNKNSAVSVGLGVSDYRVQNGGLLQPGYNQLAVPLGSGTLPSVSVAWRQRFADKYQLDVEATKASALGSQISDSLTATKVKLEWGSARNTGIGLEQGSLNLKMSSSGRFAMKIKRGGPMFYMRSRF